MRALYIVSFDPFTDGHYDVLKQAEEIRKLMEMKSVLE